MDFLSQSRDKDAGKISIYIITHGKLETINFFSPLK